MNMVSLTLMDGQKKQFDPHEIGTVIGWDEQDREDFLTTETSAGLILIIDGEFDQYPYRHLVEVKETPDQVSAILSAAGPLSYSFDDQCKIVW